MLADARSLVAPHGMVIVHAVLDALVPALREQRGDRVIISYTPQGVRGFGVAWWRPDGIDRIDTRERELMQAKPHLTHEDYAAVTG